MLAFSVEEISLINNYHCADRKSCIDVLEETKPYYQRLNLDDIEELVEGTLHKLNHISDDQYHDIDLSLAIELD